MIPTHAIYSKYRMKLHIYFVFASVRAVQLHWLWWPILSLVLETAQAGRTREVSTVHTMNGPRHNLVQHSWMAMQNGRGAQKKKRWKKIHKWTGNGVQYATSGDFCVCSGSADVYQLVLFTFTNAGYFFREKLILFCCGMRRQKNAFFIINLWKSLCCSSFFAFEESSAWFTPTWRCSYIFAVRRKNRLTNRQITESHKSCQHCNYK